MVVLAGYKTVKEALVDRGEEFGDRDQIEIVKEFNGEHGKERQKCFLYNTFARNKSAHSHTDIIYEILRSRMVQRGLVERHEALCFDKPQRLWDG